MIEVEMSIAEIKKHYGEEIAKQCEKMNDGEVIEISTATYEAIKVRRENKDNNNNNKSYYVTEENVIENAVELPKEELDDEMDMDF